MITSDTHISVNLRIFTNSLKELDDLKNQITKDFEGVINHLAKEYEELAEGKGKDIQLFLLPPHVCGFCGKSYPQCECGKPRPRPLT